VTKLRHRFVEFIPETLEEDVLYVSVAYGTVSHQCCCGCGQAVVTPLTPTDWKLTFDGETISLYPSIGNWSFPCRSHYWVRNSRVDWAEDWSEEDVKEAITHDRVLKDKYYGREEARDFSEIAKRQLRPTRERFWSGFWKRVTGG
jgi:hypothetical protein